MCGYLDDLQLFFCDGCSWVSCLFWTVNLSTVRKILHVLQILQFSSIFCIFEPFPAVTVWFWDPSFHTEDNWETQTQLLKRFKHSLTLQKDAHIFCCFRRAVLNENIYIYFNKIRKIWTSSSCSKVLIFDLSYFVKMIHIFRFCKGFPNCILVDFAHIVFVILCLF